MLGRVHQEVLAEHVDFRVEFTAIGDWFVGNGFQDKRISLLIDLPLLVKVALVTLVCLSLLAFLIRGEPRDG